MALRYIQMDFTLQELSKFKSFLTIPRNQIWSSNEEVVQVAIQEGISARYNSQRSSFWHVNSARYIGKHGYYSEQCAHYSVTKKAQPISCDYGLNFKRGYK